MNDGGVSFIVAQSAGVLSVFLCAHLVREPASLGSNEIGIGFVEQCLCHWRLRQDALTPITNSYNRQGP